MSDNLHIRTKHTSEWYPGPDLCPLDLEMLLNTFGEDGYNCYACEDNGTYYYDVSANDIKRVIDALSNMSDSQYQVDLSFEDEDWLNARETLIDELQFLYDSRDPDWGDGDWILLGWY